MTEEEQTVKKKIIALVSAVLLVLVSVSVIIYAAATQSGKEDAEAQTGEQTAEQTAEQTKKEEAKSESMLIHSIKAGMYSADISELTAYPYISFSNRIIYYGLSVDPGPFQFGGMRNIKDVNFFFPIQLLKVIDDSTVLAILHLDKDGKDVYAYVVFERESTPTRFPMKGAGTDETWRCRGKYYFVTESIASADIGLAVGDKVDSSVKERLGLFRYGITADYQADLDDLVQVADGIFILKPEAEGKYDEVFHETCENVYTCVLTDGVMMICERLKTHEVTSMTFYPWGSEMPEGFPISNGEDVIIFPITK